MSLINKDLALSGIHRAKILADGDNVRVYVPGITDISPYNNDGSFSLKTYEENKDAFPIALWCAYNKQSTLLSNIREPMWVMFEAGDVKRPVILSYTYLAGGSGSDSGSSGGSGSSSGGGTYIGGGSFGLDDVSNSRAKIIFDKLIAAGASIGGAVAVLGMMYEETRSFDPTMVNSIGATGICQWYAEERINGLKNGRTKNNETWSAPDNYLDLETQVDYCIWELKNNGHGNSSKVSWSDVTKEITTEKEVTDLLFNLVRYFETPFTATDENDLTGDVKTNYEIAKNQTIVWWNTFKDGKIENNSYVSLIGGKINASSWCYPLNSKHTLDPTTGGRAFGASRSNGSRAHAGIDLIVAPGVAVIACTDGEVNYISYDFFGGTDAIIVQNVDGSYITYGECEPSVSVGDKIKKGQTIGKIIANNSNGSSMLHFEVYAGDSSGNVLNNNGEYKYVPQKNYKRRNDLCDPTFVINLPMNAG